MVLQKFLASLLILLFSWQVVGQVSFAGQALGSGDIDNANSASGIRDFALALTLGGVAGDDSSTSSIIPTATVESSSGTFHPGTTTSPLILPSSRIAPLLFEGTATTRPFSTHQLSLLGSSLQTNSPNSNLLTSGATALPWKTIVGTAATGGVIPFQPTGSAISGASGVSRLAPTSGSLFNGSWTFSKSGMPLAPTLPHSQVLSEVSTRIEIEISSRTNTISDGTGIASTQLQPTPMVSKEQNSASSLFTYSTTSKVSSGFLKSTAAPTSFTGSATKVANRPSTWLVAGLLFFCL
ncbi:hypothetical protein ABVK25_010135 [Lepraria finkii]|uniref:Uncharacterized protein n=1 Tax=Lepraria finkii TaxID=1340010 RepID=A0ABR4AVC3_9LECA